MTNDFLKLARSLEEARTSLLVTWRPELFIGVADAQALSPSSEIRVGDKATLMGMPTEVVDLPPGLAYVGRRVDTSTPKVEAILFKDSGKFYTEERWRIPDKAITPHDMERSPDFRRIGNGRVLIPSQEPWGYPCLL
ncbi:hypothetical protein [Mycobacterium phage WXIN]|nr:hypothetical protein [Mycobacterium phage WXIN]